MSNSTPRKKPNTPTQLPVDFTRQTLQKAVAARARHRTASTSRSKYAKQRHLRLRYKPAIILLLAIFIILSSAGTYAAVNVWFGGSANITREGDIITLSQVGCHSGAGINTSLIKDPSGKAQFRVLRDTAITQQDLEAALLADCEFQAVQAYFMQNLPAYANSMKAKGEYVGLWSGQVVSLSAEKITIRYKKGAQTHNTTYTLPGDIMVADKGVGSSIAHLRTGDFIVFAERIKSDGQPAILGIFRTTLDTRESLIQQGKSFHEMGIEPVE